MPTLDLGRVRMVPKGAWSSSDPYVNLDIVSYDSGSYMATRDVPAGTLPTNSAYWQQIVAPVVPSYETRDQAVSACLAGWRAVDGVVYDIGGCQYLGVTDATDIPDLPGLLPYGRVRPEHFGAIGGSNLAAKTGPDDSAAFSAMLDYCTANSLNPYLEGYYSLLSEPFQSQGIVLDGIVLEGKGRHSCGVRVRIGNPVTKTGTYSQSGTTTITVTMENHGLTVGQLVYLDFTSGGGASTTWPSDAWFYVDATPTQNSFTVTAGSVKTNSGTVEWLNFPNRCGAVVLFGDGAGVRGVEIMAHQFSRRGSDRGHLGSNILAGDFGYGATADDVSGFLIEDVFLTRAPSTTGDLSYTAPAICTIGNAYASNGYMKAEIDGTVGVGFSFGHLAHWGCSSIDPLGNPGETYHPHSIKFEPIGPMRGVTTGLTWSSCYDMQCTSLEMIGGRLSYSVLPGDNADIFAVPRDVGKIHQGLLINNVDATLDAARAGEGDHGVMITCEAGSKWETSPAGDGGPYLRQVPIDLTVGSTHLMYDGVCPADTDAVWINALSGSARIGAIRATGFSRRAIYATGGGNAYLKYSLVDADQGVYLASIDVVDGDENSASPSYDDVDSGTVTLLGTETSATLASSTSAGATTSTLSAGISDKVFPGNIIMIGDDEVIATATTPDGGTILFHTPVLAGAAGGAAVTIQRRVRGFIQPNTRGGRYGVRVQRATATLRGKGPVNSGQTGIQVETGGVVTILGAWPQSTGQNSLTTPNYDLRILAGGYCEAHGVLLGPGAGTLEGHILVDAGGKLVGPWGRYSGSRPIQSTSSIFDYVPGYLADATTGADVTPYPASQAWTPTLNIGGSTTGITYSNVEGRYTVNGRMVYVEIDITLSSRGGLTGTLTLTGFPYPQTGDVIAPLAINPCSITSGTPFLRMSSGVATLQRQTLTGNASLDQTQITDTSRFTANFYYLRSL